MTATVNPGYSERFWALVESLRSEDDAVLRGYAMFPDLGRAWRREHGLRKGVERYRGLAAAAQVVLTERAQP